MWPMKTQEERYLSSCKLTKSFSHRRMVRTQFSEEPVIFHYSIILCSMLMHLYTKIPQFFTNSHLSFKSSGENYCIFCFVYCNRLYIYIFFFHIMKLYFTDIKIRLISIVKSTKRSRICW